MIAFLKTGAYCPFLGLLTFFKDSLAEEENLIIY